MNKLSILLLSAILLLSCNKGDQEQPKKNSGNVGPIVASEARNFTEEEVAIGKRICGSLKKKREYFQSIPDMKEPYRFKGEMKKCESGPYNVFEFNAFVSNANSTYFEYVSPQSIYFRDVVTDQTGVMETICTNLSVSDTVSNTVANGASQLRVNLVVQNDMDRFEVGKFSKNAKDEFTLMSTEGVSVITKVTAAQAKFMGVEKERVRYTLCEDAKQTSYTKQTLIVQ